MTQKDITDTNGAPKNDAPTARKKEHFLGTILLVVIIFFILSSVAGIGWVGYSQWRNMQAEKNKPTIQTLAEPQADPVVEGERQDASTADAPATETAPNTEAAKDITKEKVAVLNGGGATGAAGKLADELKKGGLTDVTTGSTTADFTGNVVYYQKEKEAEAKVLLEMVKKQYSDAVTKEQDAAQKETATAPLTVILGASGATN